MVEEETSIFMKLIFLLLLNAPSGHLTALRECYVDEILYTEVWQKFIEILLKSWQDMILWVYASFFF